MYDCDIGEVRFWATSAAMHLSAVAAPSLGTQTALLEYCIFSAFTISSGRVQLVSCEVLFWMASRAVAFDGPPSQAGKSAARESETATHALLERSTDAQHSAGRGGHQHRSPRGDPGIFRPILGRAGTVLGHVGRQGV